MPMRMELFVRLVVREGSRQGIAARPAKPRGGSDEQDHGAVGRRDLDPVGVELAEGAVAASARRGHCLASRGSPRVLITFRTVLLASLTSWPICL